MSLTLMYITNNPQIALIAQRAGVDRVWVDMEYIDKEKRQKGMDTVKYSHTVEDVKKLRPILTTSKLMVRINHVYDGTKKEVDDVINAGADYVMLPYFRTAQEAKYFIDCVGGRAKTILLVETEDACQNIDEILKLKGIDEIHIGLNDLHLEKKKKFMFELLCDGTVESLTKKIKKSNIKFGFGGVARIGYGMLPAEYIIGEHYRLGSTMAILSRGFCNANKEKDPKVVEDIFIEGVKNIRNFEKVAKNFTEEEFEKNRQIVLSKVNDIVKSL